MTDFELQPIAAPRASDNAPLPTFSETLRSGVERQSGLLAIYNAAKQRSFPRDPNFALDEYFRRRPQMLPFEENFQDVTSELEARDTEARIAREIENRAINEAAGGYGIVADIAGAILSPSTYVPFGGPIRGLKGAASITALSTGAVALDEGLLQATQETRTADETAVNLVATAILGAALGGAAAFLTPRELKAAANNFGAQDPVRVPVVGNLALNAAETRPVRGAREFTDTDQLQGVLSREDYDNASPAAKLLDRTIRLAAKAGPVSRNLVNRIPAIRGLQAQLSDAGLSFNRDTPTAVGGTIETRVHLNHRNALAKGLKAVEDEYAKYWSGKQDLNWLTRNIAEIAGVVPTGGKLSRPDFDKLVFMEMHQPNPDMPKEVQAAAKKVRDEFFQPLGDQLLETGLVSKLIGGPDEDMQYLNHVYNRDSVVRRPNAFNEMVARSYQREMEEQYGRRVEKVTRAREQGEQDVKDLSLSEEEVTALREELEELRAKLAEDPALDLKAQINGIKRELRDLRGLEALQGPTPDPSRPVFPAADRIRFLKEELKRLQEGMTPEQKATITQDNALRRRQQVLSRSVANLGARQRRVVEQLEELDDDAIKALRGIGKRLAKFIRELDDLSDEAYERGVKALEADLEKVREDIARIEKKAEKLEKREPEFAVAFEPLASRLAERRLKSSFRADNIEEMLEDATRQGPEGTRAILKEWQDDVLQEVTDRIERVGVRRTKLSERFAKVDPEHGRTRIEEIKQTIINRGENLDEWVRRMGGEMVGDRPDFTSRGKEIANEVQKGILGDPSRAIGISMLGKSSPERIRALNIPIEEKMEFLETDMDKLVRIYARQVVPDIELTRAGWGVNGSKALERVNEIYQREKDKLQSLTLEDVGKKPRRRAGESDQDFSGRQEEMLEKIRADEAARLEDERKDTFRLFEGELERIRGSRGMATNPDAYLYRGARALMGWNTITMMGNVLVPSLVDPAMVVWRMGSKNVWNHSLRHMIGNMKNLRMSQREALYAGMNELTTMDRFYQLTDLVEDAVGRRNRGEKAIDFLANKIGIVGLFSYWTQYMKQWVTPMVVGKMMDAMEVHMSGVARHGVTPAQARQTLALFQIDDNLARRIWAQQETGGLVKHNDLWVPNTESWQDVGARDAFRGAILSEVETMIVTPGLERPLFTDASIGHKLLFQFQSFMWSSHTKVLMAGLQKRDWAAMEGILASVAIGAMSYYADKIARGEKEEADNQGYDVWADEILVRNFPFLGALGQGLRVGQAIPGTRPYLQFSEAGAERRYIDEPLGAVLGPGFTTGRRISKLLSEADEPTQSTVNTFKQLWPYNQVVWARYMFNQAAENSGFPERRGD